MLSRATELKAAPHRAPRRAATATAAVLAAVVGTAPLSAVATISHGWSNVGSQLFGWMGAPYTQEALDFYVTHYPLIVIGGAGNTCNTSDPDHWDGFELARTIKQRSPSTKILLYEATQFGALCLGSKEFMLRPGWWLRDDHGKIVNRTFTKNGKTVSLGPAQIDWRNADARRWWVTTVTQAHDGARLFDGLLVDSAGPDAHLDNATYFFSFKTEKALADAKMQMLREAKAFFKQLNDGEVLGNPTLDWGVIGYPSRESKLPIQDPRYHWQFLTGTLDEMFGGFATSNPDGNWNASTMNISIGAIVESTTTLNATVLIRGYPGPCGVPFDQVNVSCVGAVGCPTNGPHAGTKTIAVPSWPKAWPDKQPTTPAEYQAAAVRLLTQAMAPYLIVAGPSTWWSYAYFYSNEAGWYPCKADPDACLAPAQWYPAMSNRLGAPLGPAKNDGWVWTRDFETASVKIDLQDRTVSRIEWKQPK